MFVLEHVADPDGFAAAAARVLRPGGSLMGLTVNKWHYFGFTTWATTRLGMCEWLLHKVRDDGAIERYHYPTEYRANTVGALSRRLARAGFTSVEFRMWDLPGCTRRTCRRRSPASRRPGTGPSIAWGNPSLMGNLTFKATL